MNIWDKLFEEAKKVQNERSVSPFMQAGGVGAAILTKAGNIYVGVNIDMCCSLGMCAERNAIANMITHGEHEVVKVLAIMQNGKVGPPCCACREFMMQLSENSGEIEVLVDIETKETVKLKELVPDYWGKNWWNDPTKGLKIT